MTGSDKRDLTVEMIEPFSGGAMVQFAHNFCDALSRKCRTVRLVSGKGFELAHLGGGYDLVEAFDIPRPDLSRDGASAGQVGRAQRVAIRLTVLRRFVSQYFRATSSIRKRQPDVVLVQTVFRYPFMPFFLGRLKRRGVKCAQFCHEFEMREASKKLTHRAAHALNRNVYEVFDTIFFLAEKQKELFSARHPEIDSARLVVVPNGNYDFFHEIQSDESLSAVLDPYGVRLRARNVLFFGRVREDKGVQDLLTAFWALLHDGEADQAEDIQLLMLGDTPPGLLADLKNQIERLGLGDHVSLFPGYVDNEHVGRLFSSVDLAVFPYRSGTQSGPLQIAMSFEVPVIVSSVGGLPEVIEHGDSGLVVEPNQPDQLAGAMRTLLDDEALRQRFATRARERSEELYSWDRLADHVVDALTC